MGKRDPELLGQDALNGRGKDAHALVVVRFSAEHLSLIEDDVDLFAHCRGQILEGDGTRGTTGPPADDGHALAVLQCTQTRGCLIAHLFDSRVSCCRM
jgi:hypothetical protein